MRRVPKLVLSALVALSVALGVAPATALADVTSLPSKDANGVIRLTENVNTTSEVSFSEVVTIDLNGYTLTLPRLDAASGAVLTITDSSENKEGKVTSTGYNTSAVFSGGTLILEDGTIENTIKGGNAVFNMGTLTVKGGTVKGETGVYNTAWNGQTAVAGNIVCNIEGGTVDAEIWGVCVMGPGIQNGNLSTVDNSKLVVNISGGTIIAEQGIAGNASSGTRAGFTVNMTAGEIKDHAGQGTGMYLPSIGVTNISGGSVTAAQAIRICAGELNVTGGTITCTAVSDGEDLIAGGSGGTLGAIVVGKAGTGYVGDIKVNVSGSAVIENIAAGSENDVYPTIVVSDKNMAEDSEQSFKDPATGSNINTTFKYSESATSVVVNAQVKGDIVKISNVTQGTSTQDGGNTSLDITGGTVTGDVINQTSEGDLSVVGATVTGDVKNESAGSVTISKATVTGDVKNTSTGDVLINEQSLVGRNVSNGNASGSVAIVNSTVKGEAAGDGTTTIVDSTVDGIFNSTAPGTNVALVGGKTYTDLQTAVNEAKNGDTVTLLDNVTLDGSGKGNNEGILLIDGKDLILDGNGKTIKADNVTVVAGTANGPSMINIQGGANVTVKNLTIDGAGTDNNDTTDNTKHGLNVYGSGTDVTVENVTIKNGNGYAIVANGSTVTINDLTTGNNGWGGINVDSKSAPAKLIINSATIREENSVKIENGATGTNNDPVTEIKGGTFRYITKGNEIKEPHLTVSGGKFATGTALNDAINVNDYLAPGLAIDGNGNVYTPSHGGGSVATTYSVTVAEAENGKVTVDKSSAEAGEKVTVTAEPDEGYEVASVAVTSGEKQVDVTDNGDGTYAFEMPAADVTVAVAFEASAPVVDLPFTDVSDGDWYYGPVAYVYARGLMTGYEGTTLFGPEDALGREQAAAVLFRALGAGAQAPACGLADVDQAGWYAQSVNWAVASGLLTGYGDGSGLFGVGDALTRDQFAAIVARVAKADLSQADPAALDAFSDGDAVAEWAVPAVSWAAQVGILEGSDDGEGGMELRSSAEITRGEMATMIQRAAEAGLLPAA